MSEISKSALIYSGLPSNKKVELQVLSQAQGRVVCIQELSAGVDLAGADSLVDYAAEKVLPLFQLDEAIPLLPVHIAKPWGEEIWFTGIEERGVSRVGTEEANIPITWLLEACPSLLGGLPASSLILLKILAPLAEPVYGDLYLEMHELKREVYVITHVDEGAWPDRIGAIRMGLNLDEAGSESSFKSEFAKAIAEYAVVRSEVDALLDECRQRDGVGLNEPVAATVLKAWLQELAPENPELMEREYKRRQEMNRFTCLQSLAVGDVVKVPTHTPHALQHGVRAVEFQTPVYERLILSFAQKVLTQSHWDTEQALELMAIQSYKSQKFEVLSDEGGVLVERIVDFEDFEVLRVSLESQTGYLLESPLNYAVVMAVAGQLVLGELALGSEEAALLPNGFRGREVLNKEVGKLVFLLAFPKK